jgi:hypothetical protein
MSAVGPVAIGMVVLWLLATIAYQYAPSRPTLGRLDMFKLLPSWSFFAPYPATRDSHVVVRDLLRGGAVTAWRPIYSFPTRTLGQVIWHPAKRPRKILRDASKSLKITRDRSTSKGVVQCSLPYLLILHYCQVQPRPAQEAVARQFAIVETSGREGRRIWIAFISEFHRF